VSDWRSYDSVAEDYEPARGRTLTDPEARELVEMAAPPSGGRVLDVGTGTGVALEFAQDAVGSTGVAVGVDVSLGMLRQAQKLRPGVRIAASDALDLPFRNEAFDAVISNFVIFHFHDHRTALFDMIRVLKMGGRVALSAWALGEDDEFTRAWGELLDEAVGQEMVADAYQQVMPGRALFADKAKFEATLRDAGLHPVTVERHEYKLEMTREDYLRGKAASVGGRFARDMLGANDWQRFMERAHAVFAERFPERINDFRDVNLAVGTKASDGLQQEDSQGLAHRT
jgi:ubiquinone/menaquinone biosynthesis C-methylase UbiE